MPVVITAAWLEAIDAFILALCAAGHPGTTVVTRRQQLQHLARRVGSDPWVLTSEDLLGDVAAQAWAQETRRGRYRAFRGVWRWGKATGRCRGGSWVGGVVVCLGSFGGGVRVRGGVGRMWRKSCRVCGRALRRPGRCLMLCIR